MNDARAVQVVTLLGRRVCSNRRWGKCVRRTTALVKNWIYLRAGAWNSNSTRNIHGCPVDIRLTLRAIIDISIELVDLFASPPGRIDRSVPFWRREMTSERKYYITRDFGRLKVPRRRPKKTRPFLLPLPLSHPPLFPMSARRHLRFSWKAFHASGSESRVAPLNKLATRVPWRGARNIYRVKRAEFFRTPWNFSFCDKMPLTRLSADCHASPRGYDYFFL